MTLVFYPILNFKKVYLNIRNNKSDFQISTEPGSVQTEISNVACSFSSRLKPTNSLVQSFQIYHRPSHRTARWNPSAAGLRQSVLKAVMARSDFILVLHFTHMLACTLHREKIRYRGTRKYILVARGILPFKRAPRGNSHKPLGAAP